MSKRFFICIVAALAALSVAGCSIKSDDGDDKKSSGQVSTTPTTPQNTTPQNTTPQNTTPQNTTPQNTTPTEPTNTTPASGRTETADINGIITTVRRYFDAGRKGNGTDWCGQQSDRLLQKNFGGLNECIGSEIANKADSDIPPGRNLDFDNSISLDGDEAKATPSTISGSTTYNIRLVFEGENGGWAVDDINNDG